MNSKPVIAVFLNHDIVSCWSISNAQLDYLAMKFPNHRVVHCTDERMMVEVLGHERVEMVLTWTFRQEWLKNAACLRVISTPAAGKDYFHIAPPPHVKMLNGQFHGELMAETAVGSILAMIRGILPAVTTFREVPWARRELTPGMRPLRGSTVVVVGFGHIGQWVGRLLKPFGVRIIGVRRNLQAPVPDWFTGEDRVVDEAHLQDILPKADHVVMALPADSSTNGFMNGVRLAMLPAHATVTNIGRGNSLDVSCLAAMLTEGRLAAACLDVFPEEPLPSDSPLRSCPNLWITPHSSAISPNYLALYIDDLVRQLAGPCE